MYEYASEVGGVRTCVNWPIRLLERSLPEKLDNVNNIMVEIYDNADNKLDLMAYHSDHAADLQQDSKITAVVFMENPAARFNFCVQDKITRLETVYTLESGDVIEFDTQTNDTMLHKFTRSAESCASRLLIVTLRTSHTWVTYGGVDGAVFSKNGFESRPLRLAIDREDANLFFEFRNRENRTCGPLARDADDLTVSPGDLIDPTAENSLRPNNIVIVQSTQAPPLPKDVFGVVVDDYEEIARLQPKIIYLRGEERWVPWEHIIKNFTNSRSLSP
jgi:hypothetical protein